MNFETMLDFFTPDADTVTKNCVECGAEFTVAIRQRTSKVRCNDCQKARDYQNFKTCRHKRDQSVTLGSPWMDLLLAVIRQAQKDKDIEYLQAEDGAQMLAKALGVKIDYDTEILFSRLT